MDKNGDQPPAPFRSGWQLYTIREDIFLDCYNLRFWVKLWGPALVWIEVNGKLENHKPIYPWWPSYPRGYYYKIRNPTTDCGCTEVVYYVYTFSRFFNWWLFKPDQTCVTQCNNSSIGSYWDFRTCRCKCKPRCCKPRSKQTPTFPNPDGCPCYD